MSANNLIEDLTAGLLILAKYSKTPNPLGFFGETLIVRDVYLGALTEEEHGELMRLDWKYNHEFGGYTYPYFVDVS